MTDIITGMTQRFLLRLPAELHQQIRTESEETGVSMNKIIVRTLERNPRKAVPAHK